MSRVYAYPTNDVEDVFVVTSGIVCAKTPKVPVEIRSPYVTKNVGDKLRLLQKNDQYFIAIVEREYEKEQERVCAFPLMSRKARQKSAWTTKSGLMFFGYKTTSCNGIFYMREGEKLVVLGMTDDAYQVEVERYGNTAKLWIPKTTPGLEFTGGPPPAPTPPPGPNRTIIRGNAETTEVSVIKGGTRPVLSDTDQGLSERTYSKLSDLFAAQQKLRTTAPTRVATVISNDMDEPWFEVEEDVPEPEPEPEPELPVVETEPEVVEEVVAVVETNVVIEEEVLPVEPAIDSNEVEQAVEPVPDEPDAKGGLNIQIIVIAVIGVILIVLVLVVVMQKLKGGNRKGGAKKSTSSSTYGAAQGGSSDAEDKDVDMSGHIASSSLGDVAQFLNAGKETGTLSIKNEEGGPLGRMVFDKGELVDAESPGHRGVEAVYDLLRHKDGFFSFVRQAEDSAEERTITQGTISLLLDVYRVIDEENSEADL